MVKTRHSGDIDIQTPPKFLSLSNEKNRQSTRSGDALASGDDKNVSKTYREDSDAYNIFNEKVVESRLRPRIGPRRAYNYLDVESSDEDSLRQQTHHSIEYSTRHQISSFTRSNRIKQKTGTKHRNNPRDQSSRTSLHEDQDRSTAEDDEDDNSANTRTKKSQGRELILNKRTGRRTTRGRPPKKRQHSDSDEDDDDEAEEEEDDENDINERRCPRNSRRQHDASEDEEDEADTLIRRSSRTRRQVYDTLNQSFLVSRPGQKTRQSEEGDQSDNKDQEDSEDNKVFSDMYSRVKRKRVQVKRNMYGVPINEDSDSEHDKHNRNKNNNKNEDDEDSQGNSDDNYDGDDTENRLNSKRVTRQRMTMKKKEPAVVKSYSLREHKPRTNLYKAPVEERRIRRIHSIFAVTPTKKGANQTYHSPAQRRNIRKRSAFHSSSSSTSSSGSESSDEKNFKRRKAKSMAKARSRMMPMNFSSNALPPSNVIKDRVKSGASLADVEPMNIDRNVTFSSIGGLGKHIRALKEMVVFPLLYDKVFQRFKVDPPRGVLFHGPPGTGKTLVARALANECSHGDRRVAFFMRKGADCLSKWVGESERQLRLLFDQAYKFRPSIIFFDEIDGLAPVRSSRQDQIHSSIVSTLLALMDGLDSRGEIVVIGATNRIDSLDPALRRPGRFDREFLFPLPSVEARKQILKIHTASWTPKLNEQFISELAEKCVGYCGADLKALVTEAAMLALRRRYPQIYITNEALQLDVTSINVSARDFFDAVNNIIPTSQRAANSPARALSPRVYHLLQRQFNTALKQLSDIFPACLVQSSTSDIAATSSQVQILAENGVIWDDLASDEDEDTPSIFETPTNKGKALRCNSDQGSSTPTTFLKFSSSSHPSTFRPRLMIVGHEGQGQTTYIAPAIIHKMENLPVHILDLPALYAVTAKTPEESCANVFHEAKRKCPSIIYLPYINQWWDVMAETLRATLITLIHDLNPSLPLLLLATSEQPYEMLDPVLQSLFSRLAGEVMEMKDPNSDERRTFFKELLICYTRKPPPQKKQAGEILMLLNESLRANSFSFNLANSGQRGVRQKRRATSLLPNNIYSLSSKACKHKLVNKNQRNKRIKFEANNAFEINMFETMSDFKIRIPESSVKMTDDVKSTHGMTLRSKNSKLCQLNSNQSARECESFNGCFEHISKEPALTSSFDQEPLHPHNKTVQNEVSLARSGHGCINNAFNNNDDSNLMNFETKMAGASTNNAPSTSKQFIRHFCHPKSGRKLRSQMEYIDSTVFNAKQANVSMQPQSSSKHFSNYASCGIFQKEPFSCGSFQMQYRKEDRKPCDRFKTRSEVVLPLNFRDLSCSHATKMHKGFKKRLHVKLPKNAQQKHNYNLRPKILGSYAQRILEVLPKAAPPKPRELTQQELDQLVEKEELTLMELRIFLRDVLNKLGSDKKFSIFAKPVNREEIPDYYEIIEHPMDLSTMMAKIDLHEYGTVRAFMNDIDFICSNALEYNPNRGPMDRVIRHRACALKDTAYAIIKTELDKDFEKMCVEIEESRKRRGEKSTTVPNFYYTKPNTQQQPNRSQTVTPSGLENLKHTRTVPKPEGERFSRRVRGLNIDPVPPLEAVEKVFKMSRATASPHIEDNKNNSNEDSRVISINESDRKILDTESRSSASETNISTKEEKLVHNSLKTTTGNKLQSPDTSSSKKKKKNTCVWCKPKRKRMKFTSKDLSNKQVTNERQEEDTNAKENGDKTSLKDTQKIDVHQQLRIETAEQDCDSKEQKSPARSSSRLKSPVTNLPVRVSTRRSSMSPCNTVNAEFNTSIQPQDKNIETTNDNNNQTHRMLIPVDEEEKSDSTMNENPLATNHQTEAIKPPLSLNLHSTEPNEKPSVVKRLDLESVALDSGVGSSVDSNGDSRDSTDHNREGINSLKTSAGISTTSDLNQNSNVEMTSRANAILDEPIKDVIIDVNRLTSLLNRLVARTDGYSVDRLEKIYSHLNQVIYRHRHNYNRTGMVLELEKKVEELTKIVSQSSSNVRQ